MITYELSAKARVLQIVADIMSMFPPKNWMERTAAVEFSARLNNLTEAQCKEIVERVKIRLQM